MAVGLALSPLPTLALVIILMTPQAKHNSLGFLAGWLLGIMGISILVVFIPEVVSVESEPTKTSGWVRFGFGVLLFIGAISQYFKRTRKGEEPVIPAAVKRLDSVGFQQSTVAGILMSAINVKNAMFIAAGTASILAGSDTLSTRLQAYFIFILLGSSLLITIIILFIATGPRATFVLASFRIWLSRNIHFVLALLLLVISSVLFYQASLILLR